MAVLFVEADVAASCMHLDIQMFNAAIQKITVGRVGPDGFEQLIRNGDQIPSPGGHVVMDDFECPLDVPVYYVATQAVPPGSPNEVLTSTPPIILASNGYSWLKDPGYPGLNMRVPVVTSIATLNRTARSGVFPILDRVNPIVVTAKRQGPTGTLVMHTLTDAQRIKLTDLIARGTVLLLQTPSAYGFGSQYVWMGDVEEARLSIAQRQERRWTMPFMVVDRPEGLDHQPTLLNTWNDVKLTYATWADLAATGMTWGELLEEGV